jgi:Ca-activated chloride channel family protein
MDISGSMQDEDKIGQAKQAALKFLDEMSPNNRVGLTVFSDFVTERVPLGSFETVRSNLESTIQNLRADGGTALYDALYQVVDGLNQQQDQERIRAVVLLSDGADTASSQRQLNDVARVISSRSELNPVIVIPVAYGSNADTSTLLSIARASATTVQSGDPNNITRVLEIISSYF